MTYPAKWTVFCFVFSYHRRNDIFENTKSDLFYFKTDAFLQEELP